MEAVRDHARAMRAAARASYVNDMREGRRQRASVIPARKGKGSYRRHPKHRTQDTD